MFVAFKAFVLEMWKKAWRAKKKGHQEKSGENG